MSIQDVINKCRALQTVGHNVTFTISFNETRIEHRRNEDCVLIAGFSTSEIDDRNFINTVCTYLDDIGSEGIK